MKTHIFKCLCLMLFVLTICSCLNKKTDLSGDIYIENINVLDASLKDGFKEATALMVKAYQDNIQDDFSLLKINYPLDNSLFPADIRSPEFLWEDSSEKANIWLIMIKFQNNANGIYILTDSRQWIPEQNVWEIIKNETFKNKAVITIISASSSDISKLFSRGNISISTSLDPVDAPIFFREVPIPFGKAFGELDDISWRLGDVSSYKLPPVVLEGVTTCINCHSFSYDGKFMGMETDVKIAGKLDKAGYVFKPIDEKMNLRRDDMFSWNYLLNLRQGDERPLYFGASGVVSPDGNYIVSGAKDIFFHHVISDPFYSQLVFPVQGILAVYSTRTKEMASLPGADDENYIQTNPVWSPDGKYIVFARAKIQKELLNAEKPKENTIKIDILNNKYKMQYDLYRIPFNEGRGGVAKPLLGAVDNGMSNYFPKYSPDGKWIIFTQSKNGIVTQPDSQLYIIPAQGGKERRLKSNTSRMNSWHSWSPNSHWLVFSSKINSAYTQLFLTHIDEKGDDSQPILLLNFSDSQKAANLPEFVNIKSEGIKKIILHDDFIGNN